MLKAMGTSLFLTMSPLLLSRSHTHHLDSDFGSDFVSNVFSVGAAGLDSSFVSVFGLFSPVTVLDDDLRLSVIYQPEPLKMMPAG